VFRAGLLCDEAVRRLINRRFVPLYFDLDDGGAAADPAARAFVVAARPALDAGTVATPDVLLMTAEGRVVAELDPYQGPREFLGKLLEVLRAEPEFARASAQELALTDPLERARLALDLRDLVGAKHILAAAEGPQARYLAGHIARLEAAFETMEAEFARVDSADYADDLRVERAQRAWLTRDLATLARCTQDFPEESERCTEALYLRGLALYHLGSEEEALALWQKTVLRHAQDPWIYRADWAYTEVKGGKGIAGFGTAGPRCSPLGRIGYMGHTNPDLARR
jgi:tetratricopeptide (TPR) repeat protein